MGKHQEITITIPNNLRYWVAARILHVTFEST